MLSSGSFSVRSHTPEQEKLIHEASRHPPSLHALQAGLAALWSMPLRQTATLSLPWIFLEAERCGGALPRGPVIFNVASLGGLLGDPRRNGYAAWKGPDLDHEKFGMRVGVASSGPDGHKSSAMCARRWSRTGTRRRDGSRRYSPTRADGAHGRVPMMSTGPCGFRSARTSIIHRHRVGRSPWAWRRVRIRAIRVQALRCRYS